MQVEASIPNMTVVPMICREIAPAPLAMARGIQPSMNAKDVIRIGRRRRRAPLSAASKIDSPLSYYIFANSTIRMAFLAARPISMTRPIWA